MSSRNLLLMCCQSSLKVSFLHRIKAPHSSWVKYIVWMPVVSTSPVITVRKNNLGVTAAVRQNPHSGSSLLNQTQDKIRHYTFNSLHFQCFFLACIIVSGLEVGLRWKSCNALIFSVQIPHRLNIQAWLLCSPRFNTKAKWLNWSGMLKTLFFLYLVYF